MKALAIVARLLIIVLIAASVVYWAGQRCAQFIAGIRT